jgi:hypothetical protein
MTPQAKLKNTVLKQALGTDTSLTSSAAFDDAEFESSARLIPAPETIAPARPPRRMPIELVAAQAQPPAGETIIPVDDEPPRFATRNWRAAAWERERERELRANDRHSASPARRRFN